MADADPKPKSLHDRADFHVGQSIASLHDAVWRVVRGIECLDLELISSAREKLDAADKSLMRAIELRRDKP